MMALEISPGKSRGYWKYHVPDKKFKQSKAMGKINNKKATLLFDSGAEVLQPLIIEGRTRLKITLAGSLVYFFDAWVTTDEISEVDINEQITEPTVEHPDDNLHTMIETNIDDPTMDDEVCIKEGGSLFAEDMEDQTAVLPEVTATTEEVKIEDLQIGDAKINTQEEIERLVQIIWKRKHLLIGKGNALPPAAKGVTCDVDVGNAKPIAQRCRKVAEQFREKLYQLIKGLLSARMIRHSTSPWASPIVMIIKKNGIDIRLCTDYRLVNSLTRLMVYPMPLINDLLDDLAKVLWYCFLDMASGFWVVPMTDRARSISAFITPFGLFEWNRMPFGLKNAYQIYQRLLDNALYGFVKVTQDQDRSDRKDVFETGGTLKDMRRSWDALCEKVEKLLDACDEWNLSISVAKSFWGRQKVDYLGHRVSAEDRQPAVVVYASKRAISAALMQEHDGVYKPVTFTSRTLKPNEINYARDKID
ncbi:Reverse transcriptase [Phytophthora palmivora]|uniref:Reverse transcriptase n=1 Tax=Phytophthora palmivora TaxID=4796 RepID=A0A2P4XZ33_9STRA|nr:Reverse transcriptase [Phytophthora palmivora]